MAVVIFKISCNTRTREASRRLAMSNSFLSGADQGENFADRGTAEMHGALVAHLPLARPHMWPAAADRGHLWFPALIITCYASSTVSFWHWMGGETTCTHFCKVSQSVKAHSVQPVQCVLCWQSSFETFTTPSVPVHRCQR